jgi:hypothetical protein
MLSKSPLTLVRTRPLVPSQKQIKSQIQKSFIPCLGPIKCMAACSNGSTFLRRWRGPIQDDRIGHVLHTPFRSPSSFLSKSGSFAGRNSRRLESSRQLRRFSRAHVMFFSVFLGVKIVSSFRNRFQIFTECWTSGLLQWDRTDASSFRSKFISRRMNCQLLTASLLSSPEPVTCGLA